MLKVANSVINASRITGVLPVVNGGTGVTTSTGTGNTVLSASPTLSGDVSLSTGNLIPSTAAKGVNFTANTPAAGMTSRLLNWYEEGTWTPAGNGITYDAGTVGKYTKVGNLVTCTFTVVFPATADVNSARIQGLPFTSSSNSGVTFGYYTDGFNGTIDSGNTYIALFNTTATAFIVNATLSSKVLIGSISYQA